MRKNRENHEYVREIAEIVWMMIERRAPKGPKIEMREREEEGEKNPVQNPNKIKHKETKKKKKILGQCHMPCATHSTPTYMVHSPGLGPGTSP
jgi:hypothetical protein